MVPSCGSAVRSAPSAKCFGGLVIQTASIGSRLLVLRWGPVQVARLLWRARLGQDVHQTPFYVCTVLLLLL